MAYFPPYQVRTNLIQHSYIIPHYTDDPTGSLSLNGQSLRCLYTKRIGSIRGKWSEMILFPVCASVNKTI